MLERDIFEVLSKSGTRSFAVRSIRGGRGLGDALYVQSVARHLLDNGHKRLKVRADWPDVFRPLGDRVDVTPFGKVNIDILAHYSARKGLTGTTQFQDCCSSAGIHEPVALSLDWELTAPPLVESRRPIALVQLPRAPMGRKDGFGADLLPDCRALQEVIDELRKTATVVQVGAGEPLFRFKRLDIDLANKTTVAQMIDLASVAKVMVGYCSFFVPLAESLSKRALFIWSRRGMKSGHPFITQIIPQKVLHKKSSAWILDNAQPDALREAANVLLQ